MAKTKSTPFPRIRRDIHIVSTPTVSSVYMFKCISCEKPYGTTDISVMMCPVCSERARKYQEEKEIDES